jgi:hypothetical protein
VKKNYIGEKRGTHPKPKKRKKSGGEHMGRPKKYTWVPMCSLSFCSAKIPEEKYND